MFISHVVEAGSMFDVVLFYLLVQSYECEDSRPQDGLFDSVVGLA